MAFRELISLVNPILVCVGKFAKILKGVELYQHANRYSKRECHYYAHCSQTIQHTVVTYNNAIYLPSLKGHITTTINKLKEQMIDVEIHFSTANRKASKLC